MEERLPRTRFTDRGLALADPESGGELPLDLFAGSMHYFRVAREDWRRCLRAMRDLGLRVVATYVPWGVHETAPGKFDWTAELDLGGFLDEIADLGMKAIVRPGPHINAELTYFGFPQRILEDHDMLAVSGRKTPVWLPAPPRMFPVPSYASTQFQKEVERWYRAVGKIVAPRLHPDGPVVAVQIDNEAQMFFRVGAYDHDYHPDAIAWWHEVAPDCGPPPTAWDPNQVERCIRWVRFKEIYVARSLAWLSAAAARAGLTEVATFHNLPPADPTLVNLPLAQRALSGVVGIDFYHNARDLEVYRRRALYLTGTARPLPFAPELGVGGPLWLLPMSPADQESVTLGLLAAGVRAFNLYMIVDRDRWYGAPITIEGEIRPPGPWLRRLLAVLDQLEWTSLRREAPVALVLSRADARFAVATSLADPVTPVIGDFLRIGTAGAAELATDPAAAEQRRWFVAIERALALAQVPYRIVDEECSARQLGRYRAVVMPTLDRVDRATWRRLHEVARNGTRVILGPGKPERDEYDRPLDPSLADLPPHAGRIRAESLADVDGLAADLEAVAGELPAVWTVDDQDEVDCSVLVDPSGVERVCFVSNRGDGAVAAKLLVPPGTELIDPLLADLSDEPSAPMTADRGDVIEIPLAPYQVRMLVVVSPRAPGADAIDS